MDGEVLSVHRRAVNLQLGGRLIAIADASLGAMPHAVSVTGFSPVALGVCEGQPAVAAGGRIRIGDRVAIDVRAAASWSARLDARPCPADLRARARLALRATRRLPAVGLRPLLDDEALTGRHDGTSRAALLEGPIRPSWPGGAVLDVAAPAARRLSRALVTDDGPAAIAAGMGLIGLGAGLTPSGDDLLVGLTAALAASGDGWAGPLAAAWAAEAPARTSEVAATFHRHATSGEYAERLHLLLDAVLAGPLVGIPEAVDRAAAWGATSGVDTLVGVILALRRRLS